MATSGRYELVIRHFKRTGQATGGNFLTDLMNIKLTDFAMFMSHCIDSLSQITWIGNNRAGPY